MTVASAPPGPEPPGGTLSHLVHGRPDPLLSDYVLSYIGFRPGTPMPPVARFLPMGTVPLMLEFGPAPGELIVDGRRSRLPVQPVVGLHDRAVLVEPQPAHGLTIMLTPPGARVLFGVALSELANAFTGAADLLRHRAPLLVEQLAGISCWQARFALLDRTLTAWLAGGRPARCRRGHPRLAAPVPVRRAAAHRQPGRGGRHQPPLPGEAVQRAGRAHAEDLRPRRAPAGRRAPDHRVRPGPRLRGQRLRLQRPRPPRPRVQGAGRLHARRVPGRAGGVGPQRAGGSGLVTPGAGRSHSFKPWRGAAP